MTDVLAQLVPETVLVAAAVAIYVLGAFVPGRAVWASIALGAVIVSAAALTTVAGVPAGGPIVVDGLAYYVRWLALGIGALFVLLASRPMDGPGTPEYLGSLLLTIAGVMLVAGASDLVLLFLGLELVSIPTYILLYLGRRDAASQESAAKYFFLSIFASAMLLYGFSFLYGTAGSTDLGVIHGRLSEAAAGVAAGTLTLANVALVLVFAGLGFKIAAVPFHFYAPDVYQGTTHANAGLLSVVPKVAGMVALVRLVALAMGPLDVYPWRIAMALAVLTMTFGNVMALWQNNVRRLLAYSSIAHAGYMLIGLSVYLAAAPWPAGIWDGVAALLLYLMVYAVATIGTFAALSCLGRGPDQIDGVEDLAGLGWTPGPVRQLLAWLIAVFMFSLAGIPPLAGFWGKLAVFASALGMEGNHPSVRNWFIALAVIGVLNAAVAAAYYLRIVAVMFFRTPLGTPRVREGSGGALTAAVACGVLAISIGLLPGMWIDDANRASPARTAETSDAAPSEEGAARNESRSPAQPAPVLGDDRLSLSWPEAISHYRRSGDN